MKSFVKSPVLATVCRIIVGTVFIFSGITKILDPWGTAVKLYEYFSHFGMGWTEPALLSLAIAQCIFEFVLGVMLFFNRGIRLASLFTVLSMCFFTLLTLYIAVFNPLDDCGCFGAAVKMGNWATFGKNLVLLPMSYVVWRASKGKPWVWNGADIAVALAAVAVTLGVTIYGWYVRVPKDTFGMPVGTNLRTDVVCSKCADDQTRLLYRNLETGETVAFGLDDKEWHDVSMWEYVDVISPYTELTHEMLERDFAIWRGVDNIAGKVASGKGTTYMVMINKPWKLQGPCLGGMERFLDAVEREDPDADVIALTRKSGEGGVDFTKENITIAGRELPLYIISTNLYEMMLRADIGVVVVKDGIITDKRFCRSADKAVQTARKTEN